MIKEIPKIGTKVRRDRDGSLYTTGELIFIGAYSEKIRLYPIWNGRAHDKSVIHFLSQYSLAE